MVFAYADALREGAAHDVMDVFMDDLMEILPEKILYTTLSDVDSIIDMHPPAPRLVGIELNPGPGAPLKTAFADLGGVLAQLASSNAKKKKSPTPVQKKKKKQQSNQSKLRSGLNMSGVSSLSSGYSRVVRPAFPYDHSATFKLKSAIIAVYTQGTSGSVINMRLVGSSLAGGQTLDLNPYRNNVTGQAAMFGTAFQRVANSFDRFRLNSLSVTYNPAVGSNTTGTLAMGYSADPFTAAVSYAITSSTQDSLSFAPWEPISTQISQLNKNLLFINDNGNLTEANQRLCYAGSILMSGAGLPTTDSILLGTLTFEGTITFVGLSTSNSGPLTFDSLPPSSSSSSSSSSAAPVSAPLCVAESTPDLSESIYISSSELEKIRLSRSGRV